MGRLTYFIEAVGCNRIKIGTTNNLEERLRSLICGCPYPIRLLGVIDGRKVRVKEKALHKKFAHCNKHNEWFDGAPEVREFISEWAMMGEIVIDGDEWVKPFVYTCAQ